MDDVNVPVRELKGSSSAQTRRDLLVARALTVGKAKLIEPANSRRSYWRWLRDRSLGDLVLRDWE